MATRSADAAASATVGRLAERLRERMSAGGPLPFADWMAACLYDEDGGFYAARRGGHPAGTMAGSDFATSPTLHPFFARAVAAEVAAAWQDAGKPTQWTVAEFGAGDGSLARDACAALVKAGVPVDWVAIDVQPPSSAAPAAGPGPDGVRWSATAPARFDAAVANEFLDALPFDVHEWRAPTTEAAGSRGSVGPGSAGPGSVGPRAASGPAWHRVGVGLDTAGRRFEWATLGESRRSLPPGRAPGERRVVMPGVALWLDAVTRAGARLALVADYGADRPATEVKAFRAHAHADPLDEPGTVDLTADVDFRELAQLAAGAGFTMEAESQEAFLLRHGVLDELNAIDRGTVEGASQYLRLRQLLLPTGLGAAFKVARLSRA